MNERINIPKIHPCKECKAEPDWSIEKDGNFYGVQIYCVSDTCRKIDKTTNYDKMGMSSGRNPNIAFKAAVDNWNELYSKETS